MVFKCLKLADFPFYGKCVINAHLRIWFLQSQRNAGWHRALWEFVLFWSYCYKSRRWEGGHRQFGRQKATTEYVFERQKWLNGIFVYSKKTSILLPFWEWFFRHLLSDLWISTWTQQFRWIIQFFIWNFKLSKRRFRWPIPAIFRRHFAGDFLS